MNILYVSSTDIIGQRFNGFYNLEKLNQEGHNAKQLVWEREGNSDYVVEGFRYPLKEQSQKLINKIENRLSIRSMLHPSTYFLSKHKEFENTDVVHYQLIQWPNFFALPALPYLTRKKKSFLTLHDMWPITGHCTSPFDCTRWQTGCGSCPYLHSDFSLRKDRTNFNWRVKNKIFRNSKLEIIVASKLMKDRAEQSPMLKEFKIHQVPFGIDTGVFYPRNKSMARKLLGIRENDFVIVLRAATDPVKGLAAISEILEKLDSNRDVHVLALNQKSLLKQFRNKCKVTDYGWVSDDELIVNIYSAADVFLMPSQQETFGMMCLEAIACGCPAIVYDGTALPEIIEGSGAGIVVKQGDSQGMYEALVALRDDPNKRHQMGQAGPTHVKRKYELGTMIKELVDIYKG